MGKGIKRDALLTVPASGCPGEVSGGGAQGRVADVSKASRFISSSRIVLVHSCSSWILMDVGRKLNRYLFPKQGRSCDQHRSGLRIILSKWQPRRELSRGDRGWNYLLIAGVVNLTGTFLLLNRTPRIFMTPKTQEMLDELEAWCDDQNTGGDVEHRGESLVEVLLRPVQKKSRTGLQVNNNLPRNSFCLFRSS